MDTLRGEGGIRRSEEGRHKGVREGGRGHKKGVREGGGRGA